MLNSLSLKQLTIFKSSLSVKALKPLAISAILIITINIISTGGSIYLLGKIGHLLITICSLSLFLIYNKNKKSLIAAFILWVFIFIPTFIILNFGEPDGRTAKEIAITTAETNLFSINISTALIALISFSSCLSNNFSKNAVRLFTCLLWNAALIIPASFYCYWIFANSLVTPNTIIAIFQTTPAEAIEYASFRGIKFIVGLFVLSLFFIILNIKLLLLKKTNTLNINSSAFLLVAIFSLFCVYKTNDNYLMQPLRNAVINIQELNSFKQGVYQRENNINTMLQSLKHQGDDGLFVIVLGESQTKTHMSAYGYHRNTTPWLKSKLSSDNFIVLGNAFSCYISTVPALSQALTAVNQYSSLQLAQAPSILEIANASGYETWWFSNQNKFGVWDTPTTIIANQAGHTKWINTSIGETIRSPFFDDKLIELINKIPDTPKKEISYPPFFRLPLQLSFSLSFII